MEQQRHVWPDSNARFHGNHGNLQTVAISHFAFLKRLNLTGEPYGEHVFVHKGAMRQTSTGRRLPSAGTRVSFVLITMSDGRLRGEDVVVEVG